MSNQNNSETGHSKASYPRKDVEFVDATEEDSTVARAYPQWRDKGMVVDGRRITLLSKKRTYQVNEEVRVIHVMEATLPGHQVYPMGSKPIFDEYINGHIQGEESLLDQSDPFVPAEYDGRVLDSPAIDLNFDITVYCFERPEVYRICWQPGIWKSNTLEVEVLES